MKKGRVAFDFFRNGKMDTHIVLSVTGDHNVSNALSAIATAELLGLSMDTIQKGLLSFSGTDRRFEYKGTIDDVTIVDDYAHHPTEIKATLKAAKHYPHRKLWCVFQPHTYTRTKAFFQEFAEALSHADHVILADIYAARETDTLGVSSEALSDAIRSLGTDSHYFPSFAEIETFLKEKLECRRSCSYNGCRRCSKNWRRSLKIGLIHIIHMGYSQKSRFSLEKRLLPVQIRCYNTFAHERAAYEFRKTGRGL